MKAELKLSQKALILVGLPVLFQIIFVALLGWILTRAETEGIRQAHKRYLLSEGNALIKLTHDSALMIYAYTSTKNDAVLDSYAKLSKQIPQEVELIKSIAGPDKKELAAVDNIEEMALSAKQLMDNVASQIRLGGELNGLKALDLRQQVMAQMEKLLQGLRELSRTPGTNDPVTEVRFHSRIQNILFGGLLVNVLVAIGLAAYFNFGTTRRLSVLMDNTNRLSRNEELNPLIGGQDEIGNLDSTFHQMAQALDEAARLKQEFVSMISHDLRTPLMSVQTSLALLGAGVRGELPDKAARDISAAERNMSYVISLINNLLEVEQISQGLIRLARQNTTSGAIIQKAQDAVSSLVENKALKLVVEPVDVPLHVDDQRLVQVIINLLSNAIKFSPKGGTITLSGQDAGELIEFRVKDEGRGIPADVKDKIFERFFQVSASDATEKRGTGLGLSICKAIVEAHSGTIGVDSEPGIGSTFWLRLPKVEQAPATSPQEAGG